MNKDDKKEKSEPKYLTFYSCEAFCRFGEAGDRRIDIYEIGNNYLYKCRQDYVICSQLTLLERDECLSDRIAMFYYKKSVKKAMARRRERRADEKRELELMLM